MEAASRAVQRAPWHLWVVGIIGLLWNSVGVYDYVMTQTRNESYLEQFTPGHIAALDGFPAWLVAAWALAVWGGVLGALLLLLRRRLAVPVLLASLLAMVLTAGHDVLSTSGLYATAGTGRAFVAVIFGIALLLWLYARAMRERGVLA